MVQHSIRFKFPLGHRARKTSFVVAVNTSSISAAAFVAVVDAAAAVLVIAYGTAAFEIQFLSPFPSSRTSPATW